MAFRGQDRPAKGLIVLTLPVWGPKTAAWEGKPADLPKLGFNKTKKPTALDPVKLEQKEQDNDHQD
jgi:hypothetical protein